MNLSLFEPPSSFDRTGLTQKLRALAQENIWIGTSSWKYEGWLDQIYTRERYVTRGRFSKKRFESECLAEFSETFPTVCGDFAFYQFPSPEFWSKLFASAPPELKVALKVPQDVTLAESPAYLNAETFRTLFLEPLQPYQDRLGPLILEFGTRQTSLPTFVRDLAGFVSQFSGSVRLAVEIRNREYLQPAYFDCLQAHGVAHVFNAWSRMPAIGEQMAIPGAFTTDFTVTRALLRKGRAYEAAVEKFQPYEKVQDENPETRDALRALIRRMKEERKSAYIYVNNRLEGNAPETIQAVVAD